MKVECQNGVRWKKEDMLKGQVGALRELGIVSQELSETTVSNFAKIHLTLEIDDKND